MNNQLVLKGVRVTSEKFSIELDELQISVNMESDAATTYFSVLKQLMDLIQNENGSRSEIEQLEEILSTNN